MLQFMRCATVCVLLFIGVHPSLAAETLVPAITLFHEGQGAYNNSRIPSLIRTAKGSLLALCEGRQPPHGGGNGTGEIALVARRSIDGGQHFSSASVVWADAKNTCGNPCPVVDQSTGTIWLLSTHNLGEDHEREI